MKLNVSIVVVACALAFGAVPSSSQESIKTASLTPQDAQATVKQYCMTCHNQRAKTANLELDTKDFEHLEKDVVAWEAVVRKLRTGMMPPKNAPRPDRHTLDNLATYL